MTDSPVPADRTLVALNSDSAYAETLRKLLSLGHEASYSKSLSIGSEKTFLELLNFSMNVRNPRERLILNPARRINLPGAVARFVWMMAGSDRLADIAFYEPKVRAFSDDGISVPGSNYGERMLQPRPGLNQLKAAIDRIKANPGTRRAAISIYHPEDATRDSHDIPCTFGLAYHVRQGRLCSTTLMRSNNAFILLPYNLFEFTLLAETVAVEVGVPLGEHSYYALSMHLYQDNCEQAERVVSSFDDSVVQPEVTIPRMPGDPSPLSQIRDLVVLEAELRHGSAGLGSKNIEEWITQGEERLNSYWRQYYYLLLVFVAQRARDAGALEALQSVVEEPWSSYLPEDAFTAKGPRPSLALFPREEGSARAELQVVLSHTTKTHQSLRQRTAEHDASSSDPVSWEEFVALEEEFGDRLAARSGEGISKKDFANALKRVREDMNR